MCYGHLFHLYIFFNWSPRDDLEKVLSERRELFFFSNAWIIHLYSSYKWHPSPVIDKHSSHRPLRLKMAKYFFRKLFKMVEQLLYK